MKSRTIPPGWLAFRNLLIAVAVCSGVLAMAPLLLDVFGAPLVVAAPLLVIFGAIVRIRMPRGWWARFAVSGLSTGFAVIFAYAFSPPVLERIGHELGWPGQSLPLWERFTLPVYAGPCTDPRFWKVFEIWDAWIRMLTRQSLIFALSTFTLIFAILLGIRAVRRRNAKLQMNAPKT